MAILRRRLRCFYCGTSSNQSWSVGLRSFECRVCDATNHLDANGEITDPPALEASKSQGNKRFGYEVGSRQTASSQAELGSTIFCHRCTNNQQFVQQALANYLPPTSDPRYKEYERSYPKYKQQLEERYPPLCINCEPRVRAQLQQASYTAKSDYMRKMLDKTRARGFPAERWTNRHYLGVVGVVPWCAAVVMQIGWNVFSVAALPDDGLRGDEPGFNDCINQMFLDRQADSACAQNLYPWVSWALVANLLSIWWNPVLFRRANRVIGLGEFYKLQALLLVLRCIAWYAMDPSFLCLETNHSRAGHAIMLAANVMITSASLRVARPDTRRTVRFTKDIPPLLSQSDQAAQPNTVMPSHAPSLSEGPLQAHRASFPISQLGPGRLPDPYRAPALVDYGDADAMDIDEPESKPSLYRDVSRPIYGPAFRETSPPAPLRIEPKPLAAARASASTPDTAGKGLIDWDSTTSTLGDDDRDALTVVDESPLEFNKAFEPASARKRGKYSFANPKLQVQADDGAGGLDNIFSKVLGFKNDPLDDIRPAALVATAQQSKTKLSGKSASNGDAQQRGVASLEVPAAVRAQQTSHRRSTADLRDIPIPFLTFPIFPLSLVVCSFLSIGGTTLAERAQTALLIWAGVTAGGRLADALRPSRLYWELSNVLVFSVELVVSVCLAYAVNAYGPERGGFGGFGGLGWARPTAAGPMDPVPMPLAEGGVGNEEILGGREAAAEVNVQTVMNWFLWWMLFQEILVFYKERRTAQQHV